MKLGRVVEKALTLIIMGGGGGGRALWLSYSFSSVTSERPEIRPSNFLTFSFYLLAVRKYKYVSFGLHLLPWQRSCREYFE